ncbi:MAG: efflux transporter outer membrane subunit [Desulfovibrio sp.]|nr:efflux transporter outer membrane subunit [Desulfovibrio sp.]
MCSTFARFCAVLCIALLIEACSFAPKYERPGQELPASWKNVQLDGKLLHMDWWTRFNDPVLNGLVKDALARNQDLAQSMAKIESAAAQAGVASSAIWPQVSGQAQATGNLASEKAANITPFDVSGMSRSTTAYQGALAASWELDFWGKARNAYTALTDILLGTVVGYEALRLSIAGQVCQSYFQMLALDMQLKTANRTLRTREEGLRIYTARYKQGDITELDWQRAKAEVETARAQVHASTMSLDSAEASLAVLTGRSPKDIAEAAMPRGAAIETLPAVPVIPAGLPSELLERRPDIRAAEYSIMATNAQIGVARAQFFPSISLTGLTGTLSAAVASLFTGPAAMFTYGAAASVPLFDGGRNWYNLKDAEAQKKQAIAVYRKTVQSAFSDVRSSLTAQRESEGVVKATKAQLDSLRRAADLARLQYDNGYTDYLTVLDAERALFNAELAYANALQNRLSSVVSVCMALGGGWQDPHDTPPFFGPDAAKLVERQERGIAPAGANPEIR